MFKNARPWRFTKPFHITPEALAEKLRDDRIKPIGPQEMKRTGWSPIVDDEFVVADGALLICQRTDERILPNHVVNRYAGDRARQIERDTGRRVGRKELQQIKDDVALELMPRAFVKTSYTMAFLDLDSGLAVVDSPSAKGAEDILSTLRRTLGSLPVRPPAVQASPRFTMTGWLSETVEPPDEIVPGEACEMHGLGEKGGKIKVKGLDLHGEEITVHIHAGKQVVSLEVEFDGSLTATIGEDISLRSVKWLDRIREKLDDVDSEDRKARLYAEFYLTSRELIRCFQVLMNSFGGEDRSAIVEP